MSPDDPRHGKLTGYTNGCRDECCRRARRIHETRRRMAIDAGKPLTLDATGTRRRIQALQRLGWTQQHIAEAAGWKNGRAVQLLFRRPRLRRASVARIQRAYDKLSMTIGPSEVTRRRAERNGWPPPLAWDDETIDAPEARPKVPRSHSHERPRNVIDPVVVERVLCGEKLPTSRAEKEEIVRRWVAAGGSVASICRRMGWHDNRYKDELEAAS